MRERSTPKSVDDRNRIERVNRLVMKTRRDQRQPDETDMIRQGEQYTSGFHTGEIHFDKEWKAAVAPEFAGSLFASSQTERTRLEVNPTLSAGTHTATEEPTLPFLVKEGWLEQYRARWGRSDRSSRRGNVLPGDAGKPRTGQRVTDSVFQVELNIQR